MSEAASPRRRVVLRARSAYILFGLAALIIVALAVDGFARGAFAQTLLVMPWFIAILWFIYVFLLRPCVILDPEGVTVLNVFRKHAVPWPRLAQASSHYQLTLVLDSGRKISSWGAPTTGMGSGSGGGRFSVTRLPGMRSLFERPTPTSDALNTVEGFRDSWKATAPDVPARSVWEWWSILVSLLVIASCVWAVLATR